MKKILVLEDEENIRSFVVINPLLNFSIFHSDVLYLLRCDFISSTVNNIILTPKKIYHSILSAVSYIIRVNLSIF